MYSQQNITVFSIYWTPPPLHHHGRTSYTAVYFSELYLVEDRDRDCLYSNPAVSAAPAYLALQGTTPEEAGMSLPDDARATWQTEERTEERAEGNDSAPWTATGTLSDSTTCGTDYPYCFSGDGECKKLNDYPWHNTGLDHIHLQEYMSW